MKKLLLSWISGSGSLGLLDLWVSWISGFLGSPGLLDLRVWISGSLGFLGLLDLRVSWISGSLGSPGLDLHPDPGSLGLDLWVWISGSGSPGLLNLWVFWMSRYQVI